MWYHVKCLGHDTSMRQHYKSELPVATRHRHDMTEKIVESDVKPKQTTTIIKLSAVFLKKVYKTILSITVNFLNIQKPKKFAVITLKF